MREVSVNSTSLHETNEFSTKGFSCLFSHRSHIHWFLPEETKCVFPTYWYKIKWISEFRRTNPQELKCWSTWWCSINLLWKELMVRMSEHTGLISSYQLLIAAACTSTGGKMKDSRHRADDRCPFVLRHSLSQVTSFMQWEMLCLKKGYCRCSSMSIHSFIITFLQASYKLPQAN